jgi:hypothetical protein
MIHMHWHYTPHTHSYPHAHLRIPRGIRLLEIALVMLLVSILVTLALPAAPRVAAALAFPRSASQRAVLANSTNPIVHPTVSLSLMEKTQAAAIDSFATYQKLVLGFGQNAGTSNWDDTASLLRSAAPGVVPVLVDALDNSDSSVRAGAAYVLGLRQEQSAAAALTAETRDLVVFVRLEAIKSLEEISAWQALPRLEQMQAKDDDQQVRTAAQTAIASIRAEIGKELGAPNYDALKVLVATAEPAKLFAATDSDFYARSGKDWVHVSRLPDTPIDLATDPDANTIFLSTTSAGLFKSSDQGATWQYIEFGSDTATKLTVTAMAVDPWNPRQVYIALASPGAEPGKLDPLGLSASTDGGETFYQLEDSPMSAVTKNLFADQDVPGYLYGLDNGTYLPYQLPGDLVTR